MEDLTGKQLGQYQLVAPLGEGGMAFVYKAYQPSMERYVALKILPRHYATEPDFVRRFKQEAKIIASLEHSNILPVHDYGEADGYTYIVMRYIDGGKTLADLMQGRPLPLSQIHENLSKVAAALDYAHSRGIVHRDIKPSNVLIDQQGNLLLSDFGLAKIFIASSKFTTSGAFLGTPTYASPEQCLGRGDLDGRSDIYSLGVMLYEMTTGRPPYDADTPMAIVVKHISDPLPPPRKLIPALPENVERIILKALAKDRDNRYQTAGEMAKALEAAVAGKSDLSKTIPEPVKVSPAKTQNKRRLPAWVWAGGCLLTLTLLMGMAAIGIKFVPLLFMPTGTPTLSTTGGVPTATRKISSTPLPLSKTHITIPSFMPGIAATSTETDTPFFPSPTISLSFTPAPLGLAEEAIWPMIHGGLKHWSRLPFAGPAHQEFNERSGFYQIGFWPGAAIAANGTRYDTNEGEYVDEHFLYAKGPDGTLKWKILLGGRGGGNQHGKKVSAIANDGTIYVGWYYGNFVAVAPDGTVKWRFITGQGVASSAAIGIDGTIYFCGSDEVMYAVHPDGTLKWKYSRIGHALSSPAMDDNGVIYIGSDNGLYAFSTQGNLLWKFATKEIIRSSPLITDQGIFFTTGDGMVYALNFDGLLQWNLSISQKIWMNGSIALGIDNSLIVISTENTVVDISQEGKILWIYNSPNIEQYPGPEGDQGATPLVDIYGTVYVPCGYPDVCGIDPNGQFLGYYRPTAK